ncbi:MAG: tryptophan synthase subunit alpha [Candidatus Melainabacteria bacterium]|nr:tryptophan synthase subunit alpha [Candidatus Melainabacteria bacterium]
MSSSTQVVNRYNQRFEQLRQAGAKAFVPFTLLGWPNADTSLEIIETMIESGATALELGLPFSEPIADGPVIQQAVAETLATGFQIQTAFSLLKRVRQMDNHIPIGLLVYYNTILAQGTQHFFEQIADCGVDGVLIADLPPESAEEVADAARQHNIHLIFIASPLTNPERLARLEALAGGFVYVVSRLGITGTEARYDTDLQALLQRLHQHTKLPCLVGFGISTPEQARHMLQLGADGVITGSRILEIVRQQANNPTAWRAALSGFLKEMVESVRS